MTVPELLDLAKGGDRRSLARLLSNVEGDGDQAREVSKATISVAGGWMTGITGAPGAGKSTLTGALLAAIRRDREAVAVVAVDPTSPFSGGAILGDRLRMGAHSDDDGVFIRSMATRGNLGGLSVAVPESVRLFQLCGFSEVLVETVGVGQVEIDIAAEADTTVVVVNPGWGDSVQASKAGLMEIADIFVINKADRPGASGTEADLKSMLSISTAGSGEWVPPIVLTEATKGVGIDDLWRQMKAHREFWESQPERQAKLAASQRRELDRIVAGTQRERADTFLVSAQGQGLLRDLSLGKVDPWEAAAQVLKDC